MKTFYEVLDFVIEKSRKMGQNDEKLLALKNKTLEIEEKNQDKGQIYERLNAEIRELECDAWGLSREINTIKWLYDDNLS